MANVGDPLCPTWPLKTLAFLALGIGGSHGCRSPSLWLREGGWMAKEVSVMGLAALCPCCSCECVGTET